MTGRDRPARTAHQLDERIACLNRRGVGAGLIGAAAAIHFPGSDASDANARPFRTPDRAIAIPDMGWCAGEGLTGGDDRGGKEGKHKMTPLKRPSEPENPPDDVERPFFEAAPTWVGRIVAQN